MVVICGLFISFFRLKNQIIVNMRSVMIMAKKKGTFDYIKEIRCCWMINPRTRVQENERKNKKKRRQEEKKMIRDGFEQWA